MLCSEIMKTEPECISPNDTVQNAASRMRDANVGFLPVCDVDEKVLGTITDRDIAVRLVAEGLEGSAEVQEVMSTECIACGAADDLETAEQLMAKHQKSRIMCLDDDGCVVGVISLSDIAKHEPADRAHETMRQVASREARA